MHFPCDKAELQSVSEVLADGCIARHSRTASSCQEVNRCDSGSKQGSSRCLSRQQRRPAGREASARSLSPQLEAQRCGCAQQCHPDVGHSGVCHAVAFAGTPEQEVGCGEQQVHGCLRGRHGQEQGVRSGRTHAGNGGRTHAFVTRQLRGRRAKVGERARPRGRRNWAGLQPGRAASIGWHSKPASMTFI